jgi:hypothetical protein
MASKNNHVTKRYEYNPLPNTPDLEARVAIEITKTGQAEIKRRRRAGLSVYFAKDGHIIEQRPDKSEIKGNKVNSEWITVADKYRKIRLKK